MVRDFDDNEFPLAYLISFRTYGTWLHGDERGSMDRKHNVYGTAKIAANPQLKNSDARQLKHYPVKLDARQRPVVEKAVRDVTIVGTSCLQSMSELTTCTRWSLLR